MSNSMRLRRMLETCSLSFPRISLRVSLSHKLCAFLTIARTPPLPPNHNQQRKRAERQFKRENAIASREEAKKYHDLVVMRKKEAKKAREEQASKRRSQNSATKSGASAGKSATAATKTTKK